MKIISILIILKLLIWRTKLNKNVQTVNVTELDQILLENLEIYICREKDAKQKKRPEVIEKRNKRQNEKKYYIKHREKKREENEQAYLKHNAENMRR